jgi:hypothetical protein
MPCEKKVNKHVLTSFKRIQSSHFETIFGQKSQNDKFGIIPNIVLLRFNYG